MNLNVTFLLRIEIAYYVVSIGGVRTTPQSTGHKVSPKQFNPKYIAQSAVLQAIKKDLEKLYEGELRKGNRPTAKELVRLFKSQGEEKPTTLMEVAEEYLAHIERKAVRQLESSTITAYHTYYNGLGKYLTNNKLKGFELVKVSVQSTKEYEMYLIENYCVTHVKKRINFIKAVMRFALNKCLIAVNPLADYQREKLKQPDFKMESLTKEQLNQVVTHQYASPTLQKIVDLFWFMSLTAFAHVDSQTFDYQIHTFTKEGMVWIRKKREKTNKVQVLPLDPQAEALLKKYNYQMPKISNKTCNALLKEVAVLHNITINLSCHVGRRTFCQLKADEGYSVESLSQMAGDSIPILLKHYYRLSPINIENDMRKLGKLNT